MIGKFKKTFETIYLNEICFLVYVYVYMVLYIQETYMVLIIYETILIIEENPELLTISLLILSNPYLSERTGN